MLSNGEIYHMAFILWEEKMRKGRQVSVVALRDYMKKINTGEISKQEMEEKARAWINEH